MPETVRTKDTDPELRLALGMRGGVSLAVWMGGACSEVDLLRRALDSRGDGTPAPGTDPTYRALLKAAGYGSVAVDVVAGASAGGLNSVLMGVCVVHDVRFDARIRDLWLRLGDLGRLAREGRSHPPASPLDGDRKFYVPLAETLRKLVPAPDPEHESPRLDAILTVTRFTPASRTRFQDLGPPIDEGRHQAWFRFQSRPPGAPDRHRAEEGTGFGSGAGDDEPLDRLAYAARATSSFPGAFEPASIGFAENSTPPHDTDPPVQPPVPRTHYGSYSDSRTPDATDPDRPLDRDFVIDGGVLDNIPVAWAVRSIAAAPADRKVDRWLLYLQPVPFERLEPATAERPGVLETIDRARDLKAGTERLADDLDEIERLNRETLRREGFRQVLEYALGQVPEGEDLTQFLSALYQRARRSAPTYRQRAGAMEAGRIRALWIDPLPVLGADPLSFRNVTPTPLEGRHAPLLDDLRNASYDLALSPVPEVPGEIDAGRVAGLLRELRSPQALARTVALLLETARELGEPALAIKKRLYVVRSTIELVIAEADRALAAAPRLLADDEKRDVVEMVRRSAWGRPDAQDQGWPDWSTHWDQLVGQARALAGVAPAGNSRAFISCLVAAARQQEQATEATAAVLAAVELLTGPLRADPLAETTNVRFHMVSARNRSRLVHDLAREDQRPNLGGASKLAGNQLSNFGAFLSAKWRLNDWIWGRLDAARSLVDLVAAQPLDGEAEERHAERLTALARELHLTVEEPEQIRDAVVELLHRRILAAELPVLALLPDDGPPRQDLDPPALGTGDDDLRGLLRELLVIGQETPQNLLRRIPGNLRRLPDFLRLLGAGGGSLIDSVRQRLEERAERLRRRLGDLLLF
jgi:hypothetical protein